MKKILSIILTVTIMFTMSTGVFAAPGDVAGEVYSTDIITYMYYAPVTSYNIGGKTCIDAEILNWHYGFDVYWYENERRLDITDKGGRFVSLQAMSGEIVESSVSDPGEVVCSYYETDIITTLNGKEIESYNIGGRTVICAEAMRDHGYNVDWDEEERKLTISKPMDFYKYETDFGTIKSVNDDRRPTKNDVILKRGVLVEKDGKQYMIKTSSNMIYGDPGGKTYIKLSDFAAILGGECTMEEKTETAVSSWVNGITDEYEKYTYAFNLNYDTNITPDLVEYNDEPPAPEFFTADGRYVVDLPVTSIMLNDVNYSIMAVGYSRNEYGGHLLIADGEIYIPAYNVSKVLGYDFSW